MKVMITIVCGLFLMACTSEEKNVSSENKPKTSTVKPNTSKPLGELKPVDKNKKSEEVRIIPNQFPLDKDGKLPKSCKDNDKECKKD